MADVYLFRQARKAPRIDRLMHNLENMCRQYDKRITGCVWVLVVMIVWCIVAPAIGTTVAYVGTYEPGPVKLVKQPLVRSETRVLHRVVRTLSDRCKTHDVPFVLAPQVYVNQQPYMYNIVHLCTLDTTMLNAHMVVTGAKSGICLDGLEKRITRPFPVTLQYTTPLGATASLSLMTLEEVCPILYALDLLQGKW